MLQQQRHCVSARLHCVPVLYRADYHGSSINQAARYMDAAAHGGQIACELDLALAVVQHWNSRGSSSSSSTVPTAPPAQAAPPAAAAATGGQVQDYTSSQQQRQVIAAEQLRVLSAPVLDHPGTNGAEGTAGLGPEAARRKSAGGGFEAAAQPSTLMSLDSSMDRTRHEQQLPPSQPGLSAAPSTAAAEDDSSLLPVNAAEADLCSGIADEQAEPSSATAASPAAGGVSSRSSFFFGGGPGEAGSTNSTRFAWLFKGAGHSSCTQQQHGSPASRLQPPQPAAAEAEQAPRLFQLPQDQVQRAPVSVEVHQLGLFKFKGNPQPLAMVDMTLASLVGRLPLLPKDPPKGKGGRVAAREGLVMRCEAHLPVLAQLYRARVPAHVLERNEFIAAVHPMGPGSPRQQVNAALRSASMPTRSYSQHNRSPRLPGQQQQQRMQDLQLAAMEGGLIGSSSSPCSPVPSPKPLQAANRSSSFTAKMFSKQGRQPSMANGTPWSPGSGDTSKSATGGSSNGPSSVDVV